MVVKLTTTFINKDGLKTLILEKISQPKIDVSPATIQSQAIHRMDIHHRSRGAGYFWIDPKQLPGAWFDG
jgi:hypothetical protein